MRHVNLLAVLRGARLKVVPIEGWETRSAPGPFTPVGQVVHHTAGAAEGNAPSLPTVINGRPGIPGPLCNGLIARDGTVYLVCAGKANDSGIGNQYVLDAVKADHAPEGDATEPGTISGNPWFYDWEVEAVGDSSPYPDVQIDALVAVCAAVNLAKGWSANRVLHHREWTSRKIDMSWRGDLRGLVAEEMVDMEEGQMAYRQEDRDRDERTAELVEQIHKQWTKPLGSLSDHPAAPIAIREAVARIFKKVDRLEDEH